MNGVEIITHSLQKAVATTWMGGSPLLFFFFTLVTGPGRSLSLMLSDTRVYEPQIRARLGTTAHFDPSAQEHPSSHIAGLPSGQL